MSSPPLTRRQRDILHFFREYTANNEISPTLEEIAQHFSLNKVTIFGHVAELERKGVLVRSRKGVSRGLQLAEESPRERVGVPILGSIAAGLPIETLEDPETLELNEILPSTGEIYALRVQGNSMIEDAICDGDLVLVERRSDARDGEIVVAILPGDTGEEATLKRLYREKGGFRLQPANREMEPFHVPEVEVRGVVIGVLRRY
jgi:repressor LexA